MRQFSVSGAAGLLGRVTASTFIATTLLLSYTSNVALQDVSTLLSGGDTDSERWRTHLTSSAAGSTHSATLHFETDPVETGSVFSAPAGLAKPDGSLVAFDPGKAVLAKTPDEERINRSDKTGRLVSVAPVAPPKSFSAGSILQRESRLLRPSSDSGPTMVFKRPDFDGEALHIAGAFHVRRNEQLSIPVPTALASLVTNTVPDILATAYAPTEPDFARESPFASLLKEEPADGGRFIPPAPIDDHAWIHKPLPAHVFSEKEQRCLAIGIYFEARGESAEGQAAVSQVILNRVRNPAFPGTICGVVYQNSHWRNRCQFSFTCDGIADRVRSPKHWKLAREIAMATTAGTIWLEDVGSSTHYHATYVHPRWAPTMKRLTRIGLHIFYKTSNGGWS